MSAQEPSADDLLPALFGGARQLPRALGAYSPAPVVTPRVMQQVERDILVPMIHGLGREKIRYHGVLAPHAADRAPTLAEA